MDLALNEAQEMLKQTARDFLAREFPKSLLREVEASERGYAPEVWAKMAELGWLGIALPEEYEGTGGSLLDLGVLLEEMGRAAFLGPYFSTVVTGALPVLWAGNEAQKQEILPRVASGQELLTLAVVEPAGRYDPASINLRATAQGDHYVLDGTKMFVEYPHVADRILCVARTRDASDPAAGLTVFIVDGRSQGLTCTHLKTTGGDKQCEVKFEGVRVPAENVLGGPSAVDQGWPLVARTLEAATALMCADMVGGLQQVLEMTVEYVSMRVQFGQPIGKFQAVQHHCANMAMLVDGARLTTYEAIWKLSEGLPAAKEVAVAKAFTSDAYREVTLTAHQLHGGIGFMQEYDLQFYSRRAKSMELKLGTPHEHLAAVAQHVGL